MMHYVVRGYELDESDAEGLVQKEAREAATAALKLSSDASMDSVKQTLPHKNPEDVERFTNGLRARAGCSL